MLYSGSKAEKKICADFNSEKTPVAQEEDKQQPMIYLFSCLKRH